MRTDIEDLGWTIGGAVDLSVRFAQSPDARVSAHKIANHRRRIIAPSTSIRIEKFEKKSSHKRVKEFGPLIISIDTKSKNVIEKKRVQLKEKAQALICRACEAPRTMVCHMQGTC